MTDERMEVTFAGRYLGTAFGWDGDNTVIWYYDFQATESIEIPAGDTLTIDWVEGVIKLVKYNGDDDEQGQEVFNQDLITFLSTVPRATP
jgi:hypothetical protein